MRRPALKKIAFDTHFLPLENIVFTMLAILASGNLAIDLEINTDKKKLFTLFVVHRTGMAASTSRARNTLGVPMFTIPNTFTVITSLCTGLSLVFLQTASLAAPESSTKIAGSAIAAAVQSDTQAVQQDTQSTQASPRGKIANGEIFIFQVHITATQHEPAGKNKDSFKSVLNFTAYLPFESTGPREFQGHGSMTCEVISRAEESDQAPHKAIPHFVVKGRCQRQPAKNLIAVQVQPEDLVTYSLLSDGTVLGSEGILKHALQDATSANIDGTVLNFAIPADSSAPQSYQCTFNTKNRHTCWFEGVAVLSLKAITKTYEDPTTGIIEPVEAE